MSALEPRILLDAAAVATVADAVSEPADAADTPDHAAGPDQEAAVAEVVATAFGATAPPAEHTPSGGNILAVIDKRVADAEGLGAVLSRTADVLVIDGGDSGVAAVAERMAMAGGYDAIHIFSHGEAGGFDLGSDRIDAASLQESETAAEVASWRNGLREGADILLYGCSVGAGGDGSALVDSLAFLTGADIGASDDVTGALTKGGDWDLEVARGALEQAGLFSASAMAAYDHILANPDLTDGATETRLVNEDGTLTFSDLSVSGTGTITVTLTLTENGNSGGVLTLAQTTNLAVTGNGSATVTLEGAAADINAALDGMTYTPTANFNGEAAIAVALSDSEGTSSDTVDIEVVQVNDAPDLTPLALADAGVAAVDEGAGNTVTLTAAHFGINSTSLATLAGFDPDLDPNLSTAKVQTTDQLTFELTSEPVEGRLLKDGAPLLNGSLFTLAELIAGDIVYEHRGSQANNALTANSQDDSFNVTIRDGASGVDTGTIVIKINPVNQTPTVTGSAGVTAFEGRTGVPVTVAVTDPDQVSTTFTFTFNNLNLQGGTLYLEQGANSVYDAGTDTAISNGDTFVGTIAELNSKLRLDVSGDEPVSAITFDLSARDDDGGTNDANATHSDGLTGSVTVTIDPVENNDHPVLTINLGDDSGAPYEVTQGNYWTYLTSAMLGLTDADSPNATLSYVITEAITNDNGSGGSAQIWLGGVALGVGNSFTQADLDANSVQLVLTGGGAGTHDFHFGFEVRDGEITRFSTVRQVEERVEGGTRNDADTDWLDHTSGAQANGNLLHQFHMRFDVAGGGGPGSIAPAPVNDVPGVTIVGISASELVEEGDTVTIGTNGDSGPRIEIIDDDNGQDEITIRLESLPTGGTILRDGVALGLFGSFTQKDLADGLITYRHDGGEQFLSSSLGFSISVSDGAAQVTPAATDGFGHNFKVEAEPVNDTPTASVSDKAMVAEGGTVTFNVGSDPVITLTDVDGSGDAGPTGFAEVYGSTDAEVVVTLTTGPSWGTLKNNGATINPGATFTRADLLAGRITYVHDGTENFSDSFVLTVNDSQGQASDGKHNSSVGAPLTVNIEIAPVNDDPTTDDSTPDDPPASTLNTGLRLQEGSSAVIGGAATGVSDIGTAFGGTEDGSSFAQLVSTDPDNTVTQIQYRITTNVTEGKLYLSGRLLGVNSTFTQDDLNKGRVSYVHGDGEGQGQGAITDFFEFEVGDAGGGTYPTGKFDIEIWTEANDPPKVTVPGGPIKIDDTAAASNAIGGVSIDDPDIGTANGTDELQVIVRLTSANGTPFDAAAYAGYTITSSSPGAVSIIGGHDGDGDYVRLYGTKAAINTYLAGLQVGSANDSDADLRLEVIADDRLRNASGTLIPGSGNDANGGEQNVNPTEGGDPIAVNGAEFDPLADTVSGHGAAATNIVSKTIRLLVSTEDDVATIDDPGAQTVNEDVTTKINGLGITDSESAAFGTDVTVTLAVGSGTLTVGAQSGVSVANNGTGTVTLTGAADDIDTLLGKGVDYRSASNVNTDQNAAAAGDTTLTVTVVEGASAIGNESTNGGDPGSDTVTREIPITVTAVNDAPTANKANGHVSIADPNSAQAVTGFSIGDIDVSGDGTAPDGSTEFDFFQVTVRLLDGSGDPLASGSYGNVQLAVSGVAEGAGFEIDNTMDGDGVPLILRGSLSNLNTALGNLQITLGSSLGNRDAPFQIQVIVDDRMRNLGTGALTGGSGLDANGGEQNNDNGATSAGAVPTDDLDGTTIYTAAAPAIYNVATATREIWPSSNNEAPVVSAPSNKTVDEDVRTFIGGSFTVSDAESDNFDLDVRVTLTTGGLGKLSVGGDDADNGSTLSGVSVVSGDEGNTLVLEGKAGDIQALLNHATNGLFFTSDLHDNEDHNAAAGGDVTVTVTLNELDAATEFSLAPNEVSDTIAVTISPVNDAPVLGGTDLDPALVVADDDSGTGTTALTGADVTVSDVDIGEAGVSSFGGGTLTVSLDGYQAGDRLTLNGSPSGVASTSGGSGAALVVTLTNNASAADVKAIIEAVRYQSVDADPTAGGSDATRVYTITLNDGNNNDGAGTDAGGPAALTSNSLTGTISFRLPPTAVNDSGALTKEDANTTGQVKTNDSDPEGALGDVVSVEGAPGNVGSSVDGTYGSLTLNADGTWTYTLNRSHPDVVALDGGQSITDSFDYRIEDGDNTTDGATLTITINGANTAPTAQDNAGAVTRGGTETATGNVITDNDGDGLDSDPESDTLTVTKVGATNVPGAGTTAIVGTYGTLTIAANGSYSYALDASNPTVAALGVSDPALTDTFTYTASDGALTDTADLVISITAPPLPPVAGNDAGSLDKTDAQTTGQVKTNDSDPEGNLGDVISVEGQAGKVGTSVDGTYGSLTLNADGTWTYTLNRAHPDVAKLDVGETLTDSFDYRIEDGQSLTDDATLTITINGVNTAPTATDNTGAVTLRGTEQDSGNLLTTDDGGGVDRDPENDPLRIGTVNGTAVTGPGTVDIQGVYGRLSVGTDGRWTYALNSGNGAVQGLGAGQTLTDTFTYTASDGTATANAQLVIVINAEPLAPPRPAAPPPPPQPPAVAPPPPPAVGSASPPSAYSDPGLSAQRAEAVPFLAMGNIDGYRQPLISPVELTVQLQDRVLAQGTQSFAIPASAFRHTDPAERVAVKATLSDGSQLPGYISFDAETGAFVVDTDVPRGAGVDGLDVRVTGTDGAGNEASTTFHITFTETDRTNQPAVPQPGLQAPGAEAPPSPDGAGGADGGDGAGEPADAASGQAPVTGEAQDASLPSGRPDTRAQIEGVGRQAAMTARDQLLTDLLTIFRRVA